MFRLIVPVVTAVVATMASACTRVDQQRFDALYRVAKEVEVDIDASSEVHIAESEKILKRFKTEISLLEGRTKNAKESAALAAYGTAADAYKAFLDMRDLDLQGRALDGRMVLGEGWVEKGTKF